MKIKYHKSFQKHYQKRILPFPSLSKKFDQRITLFLNNPFIPDSHLKDHALVGELRNYRAFAITGDIRVVYSISNDTVFFYDVGSHNQVY